MKLNKSNSRTGKKNKVRHFLGEKFNSLLIIKEYDDFGNKNGIQEKRKILCKCDCGKEVILFLHYVKSGMKKNCGCIKKEYAGKTHGMTNTKFYNIYRGIKKRCGNPTNNDYKYYGGRGIICEWLNFNDFMVDMLDSYQEGLSIERIDVNGNYSKENCKWIPRVNQYDNKQNTIYVSYNGENIALSELCRIKSIPYSKAYQRIKLYNYTAEEAVCQSRKEK